MSKHWDSVSTTHANVLEIRALTEKLLDSKLPSDKLRIMQQMKKLSVLRELDHQAVENPSKTFNTSKEVQIALRDATIKRDALASEAIKKQVEIRDTAEKTNIVSLQIKGLQGELEELNHDLLSQKRFQDINAIRRRKEAKRQIREKRRSSNALHLEIKRA